jgi:hypothetical protein
MALIGGAAAWPLAARAAWPLAARAQQSARLRRIGVVIGYAGTDR